MPPQRRGVRTALFAVMIVAASALMVTGAGPAGAVTAARAPVTVGSLTLPPCPTSPLAWCTTVAVPFDYTDPAAGTTDIYFEWFPATGPGPATGTVLTVQGGPGYASTDYRDDYLDMLGPLTEQRNVLIVDLRGTGRSDVVRCPRLQHWTPADGNQAYIDAVGACGTHLNSTRRRPDGSFVRGAELYTTANAARDVARLLGLLQTGRIDLYGDSYGTYFGQVFTSRYPSRLRSVTLDAAYPVLGADPFYPDAIARARIAFNRACNRSAACAAAAPGASWNRIGAMAAALRGHPVTGATRNPAGDTVTVTVDVDVLIQLVGIAGADSGVYRDLDPAIRAYLDGGDAAPLLRLVAQEIDGGDSGPVLEFSAGLYAATTCNDYPQPFSYVGTYAQRLAQYRAAVAARPANAFAPFTVTEWTTNSAEEFDACLRWPAPQVDDPPIVAGGAGQHSTAGTPIAPASLPVLVLSGEFDSLTTPEEGQRVAAQMGPSARWVQIGNMIHVSAMLDFVGCAEGLVRAFVARPNRALEVACASAMPEIHVVGTFAATLAAVTPASPVAGNQAGADQRRLAAVAAAALGDSIWRWYYAPGDSGRGLRGGRWSIVEGDAGYDVTLTNVRWTDDTRVSGTGTWDRDTGHVEATLTVAGPGPLAATVTVTYDDYEPGAVARLDGTAGGVRLAATVPAP
jgi:pimeloyl-ACP methyl ester carboxylesterase